MSATRNRVAQLLMVAASVIAFATAPFANADPADLVPLCSGNESPEEDNCRTPCPEGTPVGPGGTCGESGTVDVSGGPGDVTAGVSSGADPGVPIGTNPDEVVTGEDSEA
jgi:hypothetical protein